MPMENCDKFKRQMSDFLDGIVRGAEKRECEEHIATCKECAALLARLKSIRAQMRSLPRMRTSADFDAMLRARIRLSGSAGRRRYGTGHASYISWRIPAFAVGTIAIVIIGALAVGMLNNQKQQNFASIAEKNGDSWGTQSATLPVPGDVQVNYVLDRIPLEYLLFGEGVPLSSEGMQRVINSRADSSQREIRGGESPAARFISDKRQWSF